MRLRVFLLPAAMLALVLFVSSYWLPQGTPEGCDSIWRPCLSVHSPTSKPHDERNKRNIIPDEHLVYGDDIIMEECPGQDFQVSRLYLHLTSALGPASDVLLDEYLSSWEELIKFMNALGPLVSFFSHKVQEKITLLRDLSSSPAALNSQEQQQHPNNILLLDPAAYRSVLSMLDTELQAGVVDFHRHTPSGSRTLLRLHRSLLWLQLLLEKLQEGPDAEGRLRTPGELCREAYRQALAPHHPWLLRQAAEVAFGAMPARKVFLDLVCVDSQEEAKPVMWTLITAIRKVHRRTQSALEERGMLELP
ncbi:ceramide-1-phosphate transfer protein isoform X2 [Clupea harengus]|uniref:Ceramide-1-phosphate transfer protein isoform X2 n=1 Tax=Clupea harengus TaxID=7950 RepID=A0A6P3VJ28_CLUHA|nr:ceramide-1-phosphate transfer protein isoform X2 [Clupea harengus]